MTGETGMSLAAAVVGMKIQTVQTAHRLAECSSKWRLRQGTSDGRLGIRLKINRQKLKHFNFYVKVKILLTQL